VALVAEEASVVPVSLLVGQIARVYSNRFCALLASVCEVCLVALNAKRLLLLEHVPLAGEIAVAVSAQEVVNVEVLVHGLEIFV